MGYILPRDIRGYYAVFISSIVKLTKIQSPRYKVVLECNKKNNSKPSAGSSGIVNFIPEYHA